MVNDFKAVLSVGADLKEFNSDLQKLKNSKLKYAIELDADTKKLRSDIIKLKNESLDKLSIDLSNKSALKSIQDVEKAYSSLRKEAYQSVGTKSPELANMASYYKDLEKSITTQNKLGDSMELTKTRAETASKSFTAYTNSLNPKAFKQYSNEIENIKNSFSNVITSGNKVDFSKATASMSNFKATMKEVGLESKSLGQYFKDDIAQFGRFMLSATSAMTLLNTLRSTVGTVITLDGAVTDLRLATGESAKEATELLKTYSTI
jgi:hypothetical protein